MAENLQATEETKTQTREARPLLTKTALAFVGVAAAFGSVSPAMAASPTTHEAAAHKAHHKAAPLPAETPVQKATTSTVQSLAAQIIADYNQVKRNPMYQGIGYIPEHPVPEPGSEDFYVEYPTGTDTIVNNGITENIGTGGYRLSATISYPRNDKTPPTKINLNNVTNVGISETTSLPSPGPVGPGYSSTIPGPSYYFSVTGNDSNSTKDQWDLSQEIDSSTGQEDWSYVAGAGTLNKGNTSTSYVPLTMHELQEEITATHTLLNSAQQYAVTLITPALEATLGPPTKQLPPIPPPTG